MNLNGQIGFKILARGMAAKDGASEEVVPFEGEKEGPEPRYKAGEEISAELDYFYLSRSKCFSIVSCST